GLQEVAVLEAVVAVALHRRGAVEQPGNSVIGNVVLGLMEVAEGGSGRRPEAERERRRQTEAPVLRDVAARDLRIVPHYVETERRAIAERGKRLIEVGRDASRLVRSHLHIAVEEAAFTRRFGALVERAARGAAAEGRGGRSFQHLHFLGVERVAIV